MSQLDPADIARYARDAGFRGNDLTTAVAVALAESGGNTQAHNATPPDNSYGLWQINMLGNLGPARLREFGIKGNDALFRPEENAKAAKHVFDDSGGSFSPWSTYTNGAYKSHLDEARRAVANMGDGGGGSDTGGHHHGRGSGQPDDGHHHDGDDPTRHKPGTAWQLLHGANGGFDVDPDKLMTYAKHADEISDRIGDVAKHKPNDIRPADKAFGSLGDETGFTNAMGHFTHALRMQLVAIHRRVGFLGSSSRAVAKVYREVDDTSKKAFQRAAK